jgi:hypothetical protein
LNISASRLSRPFASLRGRPPSLVALRPPPKGASRAVRARSRSPVTALNAQRAGNTSLQKIDQTLCHFQKVAKTRQKAVSGVWAQPILARRSPAGPRSGPRSEDRGGEVPAPERPQRGPGSLDRGQGRPQIPLSSPPALLKPHFDSRTVKHSSANKRGAKPLKYNALVRESGAPKARFSNGSVPADFLLIHAALAATAHLVHDVCRWVGRRGARRVAVGERSSATEPHPKGGEADRSGAFGRREPGPGGDGDRRHKGVGQGPKLRSVGKE